MENPIVTVAAQYANSPTLMQMIDSMNQYFDPSTNFAEFYDYVWNVETAQGFGLDVWGKIVNVGRDLTVPGELLYFGFEEAGDALPFGQMPFYNNNALTQTYRLEDDVYRVLILTKALANISESTPASLNKLLQNLFPGRGRAYVLDLGGMQMRFVFEFLLEPFEYAILTQSGAVPHPAGVGSDILQVEVASTFGFMEGAGQPFGSGVFFN